MKKEGFTLVELLAVIVILAIILAIAGLGISNIIKNSTKSSMESDAKLLLKAIDLKKITQAAFNPLDYNNDLEGLLSTLKLSDDNYESIIFTNNNGKILITVTGKNKWRGLTACGSYHNMNVYEGECELDLTPPVIVLNGDNPMKVNLGSTYDEPGATVTDNSGEEIEVVITGSIDINVVGTYTITYKATDSSGNTTTVTRTVEVIMPIYSGPGYINSKGVNGPVLATGMIPVKWVTDHWEITTIQDRDWYEYGITSTTRRWANAIQVTNPSAYSTPGTTVDVNNDVIAMWVWIPRYAYQIETCYHMTGTSCYSVTDQSAGKINIKFLKNTGLIDSDDSTVATTPTYSGSSQTNYIKHPAFKFGNKETTGMWVAKFEMSAPVGSLCRTTPSSPNCTGMEGQIIISPDSVPNAKSWGYVTLGDIFKTARNMEKNNRYGWPTIPSNATLGDDGIFSTESGDNPDYNGIDTHMIKNMEWGAVAYLYQSKYGKNSEIYRNPSSNLITGRGGQSTFQSGTTDDSNSPSSTLYAYDGKRCSTKTGFICTGETHATYGTASSTTGNIYGIYDMGGGSHEYVMGNRSGSASLAGINPININDKYIDRYTSYNNIIYGDALWETSGDGSSNDGAWYNNYTSMSSVWFCRGGHINNTQAIGPFFFAASDGSTSKNYSWRVVLLVEEGL